MGQEFRYFALMPKSASDLKAGFNSDRIAISCTSPVRAKYRSTKSLAWSGGLRGRASRWPVRIEEDRRGRREVI